MSQKKQPKYLIIGKISVITCALLGFLLILTLPAWGSPGHVHKNVSPFEKNGQKKNMHCLLNKHNHQNQICPHALLLVQKNKDGFFLSTECGGNPQGSNPVKNIFNNNPVMTTAYIFPAPLNPVEILPSNSFLHLFHLSNSLDRPPQSV